MFVLDKHIEFHFNRHHSFCHIRIINHHIVIVYSHMVTITCLLSCGMTFRATILSTTNVAKQLLILLANYMVVYSWVDPCPISPVPFEDQPVQSTYESPYSTFGLNMRVHCL